MKERAKKLTSKYTDLAFMAKSVAELETIKKGFLHMLVNLDPVTIDEVNAACECQNTVEYHIKNAMDVIKENEEILKLRQYIYRHYDEVAPALSLEDLKKYINEKPL